MKVPGVGSIGFRRQAGRAHCRWDIVLLTDAAGVICHLSLGRRSTNPQLRTPDLLSA
jgi:hypothetical protein